MVTCHEHWCGPQSTGGEYQAHRHEDGEDIGPHHHLFAGPVPVTIPQDEFEFMRKAAVLAHLPRCEDSAISSEQFGARPGYLNIDLWPDGRWVVECHARHRDEFRARGDTAVDALRGFIAMHAG